MLREFPMAADGENMGREEDDEHSPERTLWPSVRNRHKIRKADWQRGFNFSPVLSLSLVQAGQLIDRHAFHTWASSFVDPLVSHSTRHLALHHSCYTGVSISKKHKIT